MMNSLRHKSARARRMNLSSPLQQTTPRQVLRVDRGQKGAMDAMLIEANGFDAHLQLADEVSPGEIVTISAPTASRSDRFTLSGLVHWSGERRGQFEAGIAMQNRLPESVQARTDGCRRDSLRYSCRVSGLLEFCDESDGSIPATAINYCRNGACFRVPVPPRIGAHVVFAWAQGDREHRLDGVIPWVIGQGGAYLAGAEFIGCFGYQLAGISLESFAHSWSE